MQKGKIQNLQSEVAELEFNGLISNQQSSVINTNRQKKRNNLQPACKRLKYTFQRRFVQLDIKNQIYNCSSSYRFNDTNHFYQSNGTQLQYNNSSATNNLLSNNVSISKIDTINTDDLRSKTTSLRNKTSNSSRTKIVNLTLIDPNQINNQFMKIMPNSYRSAANKFSWTRSKSSIQSRNTAKQGFKLISQKQLKSRKNYKAKHINPYTNQQYLYFRRKQKDEVKRKMLEIKKKQLQINILKPCQIYQKQLNIRQLNKIEIIEQPVRPQPIRPQPVRPVSTKSNRRLSVSSAPPKRRNLNKTILLNFKEQQCGIRPWESFANQQFMI